MPVVTASDEKHPLNKCPLYKQKPPFQTNALPK